MQKDLTDPTTATLTVAEALSDAGIEGAVYGGLALGAYGEPRETKDADFAVRGVNLASVLEALRAKGVEASPTFEGVRFGGNTISRVMLLGAADATGLNVLDLIEPLSTRYGQGVLERALRGSLRGTPITIVTPEDFVLLKILSTRERDLEDARSVMLALGPRLDRDFVRREASLLATEIPDHAVLEHLARVEQGPVEQG